MKTKKLKRIVTIGSIIAICLLIIEGCENIENEKNLNSASGENTDEITTVTSSQTTDFISKGSELNTEALTTTISKEQPYLEKQKEFDSITESYKAFISAYEKVKEVLNAQSTGKGITLEDFNSKDLQQYSSALRYVNGVMQLNVEEVENLAKEKSEKQLKTIELADTQDQLEYKENAKKIDNLQASDTLDNAEKSELAVLQERQTTLSQNDEEYSIMVSNIRQATGAYQQWLYSQNVPEPGDMANDVRNALAAIKIITDPKSEDYARIGTKKFQAAINFVVPDNIPEGDVQAYVVNIETYFKDKSGADKFIADALDKGLMTYYPETGKAAPTNGKMMKNFSDEFNWTPEVMQAMFGELQEYGGDFNWEDEAP